MVEISSPGDKWVADVEKSIKIFAKKHRSTYNKKKREVFAHFEIGCFLALVKFYENIGYIGSAENLTSNNEYRYLTTPNGNPENFSYMGMRKDDGKIEIRQQVRIASHVGANIAFTPDIVVINNTMNLERRRDDDYAGGKRSFFCVSSEQVIAAHECKSMVPFPELLVSFVGMLIVGHKWMAQENPESLVCAAGEHLAPTIFIGGQARPFHYKMIEGMKKVYPINIIVGMHDTYMQDLVERSCVVRIKSPLST